MKKNKEILVSTFLALIVSLSIGCSNYAGEDTIENDDNQSIENEEKEDEQAEESKYKTNKNESEEKIVEKQMYTYEDFKGTYVTFEGQPYNSPIDSMGQYIMVLGDDFYQSFNRWDFDMTSTILDKTIEGNVLTLDLDSDENETQGLHSESGTEQFELRYDGDKKVLYSVKNDSSFYPMSKQELQTYYSQSEIDYARIIMTMRGVPSLDYWQATSSEYDGDKPIIGVSPKNKGDIIPYTDDDGDVGYPEDVTDLYLRNKTRQDEISYTYSSIGEGYIKVYPVPLNHAIRTGEEVIKQAEKIYIEPFEPFEVADFIGHVEFVYE